MRHRFSPILQIVPNIQEAVVDAETPFDFLIGYVNFWAKFTGVREIQIDKVRIFWPHSKLKIESIINKYVE